MRTRRTYLLAWLCSAAAVTLIRVLHATDLGYDPTLQIQAAQNLLSGNGLSIYWSTSQDLADALTLEVLTHFSAGYSLYAAALMAAGIGEATIVKILGAAATMVGWWGWADLASMYLSEGSRRSRFWQFAGFWIAVATPLLFTSRWAGTDIVLWAAVPWVLSLVVRAPDADAGTRVRSDVIAGLLVGVCVLARYAGVFLVGYVVLVIAGQSRLRTTLALRRLAAFAVGLLPAFAIQGFVNYVLAAGGTAPGGVSFSGDRLSVAAGRLWESVTTLGAANHGVFFWLPATLRFWPNPQYESAAMVLAGSVLIGVPICLATRSRPTLAWFYDRRVVAAGMLVALPLFLWVCGLVGTYAYIKDLRYYEMLRPLAVCIAYFLATMDVGGAGRPVVAVANASRLYVLAFIAMTAVEMAAAAAPIPQGAVWRRAVLGAEPRPWPSFGITYESFAARRFVLDLMKADPHAILLTTREPWFYADPEADRSRVVRLEVCETLRARRISGPVRFIVFEQDLGEPTVPVRWPDRLRGGRECWPELPNVSLVRRFPEERLRVLQAVIPAGLVIPFAHPQAPGE